MELPDASLELVFSDEALVPRFKTVAVLPAVGAVLFAPPARVAAGTAFCAVAAFSGDAFAERFTVVLAAAFVLLFTVVLTGLATVFVVAALVFLAGVSASVSVFASLFATVFNNDLLACLLAVLAFDDDAVLPVIFFVALLAVALFVADLVTVAFIFILFLS